jgi:hypothetical protein
MFNTTGHPLGPFMGIIIALAFFVQSFLPMGYMPQFNTGKFFEVTICHGDDLAKVLVDEHMQPVKNDDGQTSHKKSAPCLYSSVTSKNITLQTFLYQQTEQLTYEQYVVRNTPQLAFEFIHTPYNGRAPPSSFA